MFLWISDLQEFSRGFSKRSLFCQRKVLSRHKIGYEDPLSVMTTLFFNTYIFVEKNLRFLSVSSFVSVYCCL